MLYREIMPVLRALGYSAPNLPKEQRYPIESIPRFCRSSPEVRLRLMKANPDGVSEGCYLRGWHPHAKANHREWRTLSPREFVSQFGRAAYDALDCKDIIRRGHRKGVSIKAVRQICAA